MENHVGFGWVLLIVVYSLAGIGLAVGSPGLTGYLEIFDLKASGFDFTFRLASGLLPSLI